MPSNLPSKESEQSFLEGKEKQKKERKKRTMSDGEKTDPIDERLTPGWELSKIEMKHPRRRTFHARRTSHRHERVETRGKC